MADGRSRAVVSVIGRDQKGVVARISTYLASADVNIEDIEQRVMEGLFIMTMLVDLSDCSLTLDELVTGLQEIARDINMEVKVRLAGRPPERKRVAVLVTKEGHCLEQLLRDRDAGKLAGDMVVVLSNHPTLEGAARAAGIPFESSASTDKQQHFDWLLERLAAVKPDLVVLARYMQILSSKVIDRFPFRIINIHPSLLPYFPGANPYRRAWEDGVRVTGCTAHFVTEELDAGPIILQDVFHIDVGVDAIEDVRRKGRALEGVVLSKALQLYLNNEDVVINGKVVFKPGMRTLLRDFGGSQE